MSVPFVIASLQAGNETLRARIMQRQRAANDASEADIAVLEKLLQAHEPLAPQEQGYAAHFFSEDAGIAVDAPGWSSLLRLMG